MSTGTDILLTRALNSAVELNSGKADVPGKIDLKQKKLFYIFRCFVPQLLQIQVMDFTDLFQDSDLSQDSNLSLHQFYHII